MPLPTNINAYSDIAAILETAYAAGPTATYRLSTPGKARHWIQRAYAYRKLLQAQEAKRSEVRAYQPPTPYDRMKLTLSGSSVLINFNPQPDGELVLGSGETIKPAAAPPKVAPPQASGDLSTLSELAIQLAEEKGNED